MKVKKHLFISVIILLTLGCNVYSTVVITSYVTQLKTQNLQDINKDELIYIKGIIYENYDKAKIQADNVKDSASKQILATYANNTEGLKSDLSSVGDKPVYHILQNSIDSKYLNVQNDNNDMNVWTKLGKVADTSKNCAFEKGEVVTVNGEIAKQNDKALCKIALDSIYNQENKKWLFWNYLPTPDGYYVPSTMDESEIDTLYNMYGYKGLQYLEFLTPSYLNQNSDITGTPDLDQNGVKTDNYKIIFVQGFNIVDDLDQNHSDTLQYYSDLVTNTTTKYDTYINIFRVIGILIFSILILAFFSIVREINKS